MFVVIRAQTAKAYARELFEVLKLLKRTRDMSVNEVKLVVSIDDPRGKRWTQSALSTEEPKPSANENELKPGACTADL
eukprot:1157209-Pelagomonas_calceolata.AAC.1